jgi:hypothetical protein
MALIVALTSVSLGAVHAAVDQSAIDAAITRGVRALRNAQKADGTYHATKLGATALVGLALVECGEAVDSRAVSRALAAVRKAALTCNDTYSISLSILLLDRVGEPTDTPLIESLIVRLLAGQQGNGGWSYECPSVGAEELRRIKAEMDGSRVLRAGGDLKNLPPAGKRTSKDLPEAVKAQLATISRAGGLARGLMPPDNSNTQFAVLALWTGRRYGIATQPALVKAYNYFHKTQGRDGGWNYHAELGGSTPTMTCAGVLALAVGHGANVEIRKEKGGKADSADVSKDANLKAGLLALGTAVGAPVGWDGIGPRPGAIPSLSGKGYYYLWSLERICVALGLKTIAKKDWYHWGAELLLANQSPDGTWRGEFSDYQADTCFALLFLKKANLTGNLSERLTGLKDPGEKVLKAGGVGGGSLIGSGELKPPGVGEKPPAKGKDPVAKGGPPVPPKDPPPPRTAEEKEARGLARSLRTAPASERQGILDRLRDTRGVAYTEALAYTIPLLDGDLKKEARQALTLRLSRMKDSTLGDYLTDEDEEIRRAAALACGTKGTKAHLGQLVRMLRDGSSQVSRAAHAALKALTGKPYGLEPAEWERWWKAESRE